MEKVRYMISDAAGLVNVEAHVLRYWEEELELDIPRNELGHRYYTKENIEQFLKIKEWKEKGYQLKAIKMLVHEKSTEPEAEMETRELLSAAESLHTEVVDAHSGKVGHAVENRRSEAALSRMEQFQMLMTSIVKSAIEENNHALGKEVGDQVGDRVLKEMNYLMRTGRTGGRTLPEARRDDPYLPEGKKKREARGKAGSEADGKAGKAAGKKAKQKFKTEAGIRQRLDALRASRL